LGQRTHLETGNAYLCNRVGPLIEAEIGNSYCALVIHKDGSGARNQSSNHEAHREDTPLEVTDDREASKYIECVADFALLKDRARS
jgi:hypothetical protein